MAISSPRPHTNERLMLNNPPKGYVFVVKENKLKSSFLKILINSKLIKFIYRKIVRKIVNPAFIYKKTHQSNLDSDEDLIFSESFVLDTEKDWVLDIIDNIFALGGNDYHIFLNRRKEIEEKLSSSSCKKIIIMNETTLKMIKKYFSKRVIEKCVLVRAGINIPNFKKTYKKEGIQILFMGSIANPDDFIVKGGVEALEVFKRLSKKHRNLRFIVRSKVPSHIKDKYSDIKNLKIIEGDMTKEDLNSLYANSDFLLNPAHMYPLMTILESMSYGLPIVMLDTYAVRDYLDDKCAILVKPSTKVSSYHDESYPANARSRKFLEEISQIDENVIKNLYASAEKLIKNYKLREEIGKNARKKAEKVFSLKVRNKKLKSIFDEIISSQKDDY